MSHVEKLERLVAKIKTLDLALERDAARAGMTASERARYEAMRAKLVEAKRELERKAAAPAAPPEREAAKRKRPAPAPPPPAKRAHRGCSSSARILFGWEVNDSGKEVEAVYAHCTSGGTRTFAYGRGDKSVKFALRALSQSCRCGAGWHEHTRESWCV
jgi:hypothetical protein